MPVPADLTRRPQVVVETSIDPSKLYRSDELSARMGWRPSGWRAARRAGLLARKYGKRWFVLGADVIAFVQEHGES
ncbi:MAG: hypothetical protein ACKOSQ_00145 [Planctomycetaceae bacterium]